MTAECPLCGHLAPSEEFVDDGCPECSTPFMTLLDHAKRSEAERMRSD